MTISREEVRQVASLARLRLTDAEENELVSHFNTILTYVDKLSALDTEDVTPTAHAVQVPAPLREDIVTNAPTAEALLANAPGRRADFFCVPKIIE